MGKDTFAARATRISNKYKKRLGDNFTGDDELARKGLDLELTQLKKEQEAVKASMAFDDEFGQFENITDQMANGGQIKIKPSKVGTFTAAAKKRGMGVQEFASTVLANKSRYSTAMVKKANFAKNASKWKKEYGGSLLPKAQDGLQLDPATGDVSVLPLAASALGNIYMYSQANKMEAPEKVSFGRIRPEEISLSRARQEAREDATLASNIASGIGKRYGLSGGAGATASIASLADINKAKATAINRAYTQEELANAQARTEASKFNVDLAAKEDMFNIQREEQFKYSTEAAKQQAIQNIIADTSAYFGDIGKQKKFLTTMESAPGTAGIYTDPEQTRLNKILFGERTIVEHDPTKVAAYNPNYNAGYNPYYNPYYKKGE